MEHAPVSLVGAAAAIAGARAASVGPLAIEMEVELERGKNWKWN